MFSECCDSYYNRGLSVIPAGLDKKVIIDNFAAYSYQVAPKNVIEFWKARHKSKNLGIMLGPVNNLIAIDIDTNKKDVIDLALDKLPKTVSKFGSKGMTLFYKFDFTKKYIGHTWLISKEHGCMLEFLLSCRYTVIPPSIHPTTKKPYTWLNGNLLEGYNDIPYITNNDLDLLEDYMRVKYDCLDFQEIQNKKRSA